MLTTHADMLPDPPDQEAMSDLGGLVSILVIAILFRAVWRRDRV